MDHVEGTQASKGIKKKHTGTSVKPSADEFSSAKVNLSERAQDMKKVRAAMDSTPDVDEAKVAKFKSLINSGNYKVDSGAVADKMVNEHAYNDFLTEE